MERMHGRARRRLEGDVRLLRLRIAGYFFFVVVVGAFVQPEIRVAVFGAQADGAVEFHEEVVAEGLEDGEVEGLGGLEVGDGDGDVGEGHRG